MTQYFQMKSKEPLHFQTFTVAIAVDAKNLVAIDAAGLLVPAADATAVTVVGFSKQGGAVAELVDVGYGEIAFDNDGTTAVTAANVGETAKVGADASNISLRPAAGLLLAVGRIRALDNEGKVWVSI